MEDTSETAPVRALPIIAYADIASRHGVVYESFGEGCCRITFPRLPLWKSIPTAVGLLIAGMFIAGYVGFAVTLVKVRGLFRIAFIEVTADSFVVQNMAGIDKATRPRAEIYRVAYVGHANMVVIRAGTADLLELRPRRDCKLLKWLAETLCEELGLASDNSKSGGEVRAE
jgi:hypothetical protein